MDANYNGCITQLDPKGVHGGVGFRGTVKGLADANMAAVGGWDIRPTKLGDALLEGQILDYDMVRQLQDEMNHAKVFRGYYDPRFIGSSQHATATHILSEKEVPTANEALKSIRADIRYFKWRNGVVGHTTVIWSASVEPNSELCMPGGGLDTARDLLNSFDKTEAERGGPLSPSLIYATAAILEGCSFINGGSQNTLCQGLSELARQQPGVYCLGTDFKAGQTKFKTAAVEYVRTMGFTPKVIASSNHLGNNDMRNLATSDVARNAKLRVKHDIFAPWEEDQLDHKVAVMYTPFINDEKRDFVEYTSLGFLGQQHTMVTYTRASDSVLCVPLMIDGCVWCDFFSSLSWPYENVAKSLAYLFKVPEGAAKGVDPGFFAQMAELRHQLSVANKNKTSNTSGKRVRIRNCSPAERATTEWAIPSDFSIVCSGLACVDMQLNRATGGSGGEAIETFHGETSIGGGSVSMACKTLARLCHGAPLDADYMQITPPVVHTIIPLCKVGYDDTGNKLISLLEKTGSGCRNVHTKYIKDGRKRDPNSRTALSVLPIYLDGRRGCFFDAAGNVNFGCKEMMDMLEDVTSSGGRKGTTNESSTGTAGEETPSESYKDATKPLGAFLFGYPHLLPMMQGEALAQIFSKARTCMEDGGIIALDLNGIPSATPDPSEKRRVTKSITDIKNDPILGCALNHVDILHMNEEELISLTGCQITNKEESQLEDDFAIAEAANLFIACGVAVVAVTLGKKGCFISCGDAQRFARSKMLPLIWADCTAKVNAYELPPDAVINTNGAGDAFTSGLLIAAMLRRTGVSVANRNLKSYDDSSSSGDEDDVPATTNNLPVEANNKDSSSQKKKTAYTLYIRDHFITLKEAQSNLDKKAIFLKCHELWESESTEIKAMYERKCKEELEEAGTPSETNTTDSLLELVDIPYQHHPEDEDNSRLIIHDEFGSSHPVSLNLDTAGQLASLVASYHVDVSTRDLDNLDLSMLLDRAMIFPHGLEEI